MFSIKERQINKVQKKINFDEKLEHSSCKGKILICPDIISVKQIHDQLTS